MESRASTRLNENIKLLTLVSIFFLTLSFCMVFPSPANTKTNLTITTVRMECQQHYFQSPSSLDSHHPCRTQHLPPSLQPQQHRRILQSSLQQAQAPAHRVNANRPRQEWKETGQKFTSFQPKQEKRQPSEWTLVLFVFHKAFGRFQFPKRVSEKEKEDKMRSKKEGSMPDWPDLPLPQESAQATDLSKVQTTGPGGIRKKCSNRGRFSRLSIMFRRGAFSPGTTANV